MDKWSECHGSGALDSRGKGLWRWHRSLRMQARHSFAPGGDMPRRVGGHNLPIQIDYVVCKDHAMRREVTFSHFDQSMLGNSEPCRTTRQLRQSSAPPTRNRHDGLALLAAEACCHQIMLSTGTVCCMGLEKEVDVITLGRTTDLITSAAKQCEKRRKTNMALVGDQARGTGVTAACLQLCGGLQVGEQACVPLPRGVGAPLPPATCRR